MQAIGIHGAFASAAKIASRRPLKDVGDPVADRLDKLDRWHAARRKGLGGEDAAHARRRERQTAGRAGKQPGQIL